LLKVLPWLPVASFANGVVCLSTDPISTRQVSVSRSGVRQRDGTSAVCPNFIADPRELALSDKNHHSADSGL
jgi:hypothetical protein